MLEANIIEAVETLAVLGFFLGCYFLPALGKKFAGRSSGIRINENGSAVAGGRY
jgi:hypothetical protein